MSHANWKVAVFSRGKYDIRRKKDEDKEAFVWSEAELMQTRVLEHDDQWSRSDQQLQGGTFSEMDGPL